MLVMCMKNKVTKCNTFFMKNAQENMITSGKRRDCAQQAVDYICVTSLVMAWVLGKNVLRSSGEVQTAGHQVVGRFHIGHWKRAGYLEREKREYG